MNHYWPLHFHDTYMQPEKREKKDEPNANGCQSVDWIITCWFQNQLVILNARRIWRGMRGNWIFTWKTYPLLSTNYVLGIYPIQKGKKVNLYIQLDCVFCDHASHVVSLPSEAHLYSKASFQWSFLLQCEFLSMLNGDSGEKRWDLKMKKKSRIGYNKTYTLC